MASAAGPQLVKMLFGVVLAIYLAAVLAFGATDASNVSPTVKTRLRTGWLAPPLLLEALEYVALENASAYFPMLAAVAAHKLDPDGNEAEDAFALVENGGFLDSASAQLLYRMSLSFHTHAPAVQSYYHLYDTTVVPALNKSKTGFDSSCPVWVEWAGRQHCSIEAFRKAALTRPKLPAPTAYSFDHAMRPAESAASAQLPVAVVYADIFSEGFGAFHSAMAAAVDEFKFVYVLRYRPPVNRTDAEPLLLSGYGVELWIKKTDYKVIDDRKVVFPADDSMEDVDEEEEDEEETNEPIEKVDEQPTIIKLEEAQVKDLGNKAADYILSSPNPLRSLAHVSQNFPRLAHRLVDHEVSEDLVNEIVLTQQNTIATAGFSGLWINGLDVGADTLNVFQLLRFLRAEARVVDAVTSIGFDARTAVEILNTKVGDSGSSLPWGDTFDTRDEHAIIWLNDLEKDRRYASWPKSLRELLRPGFPNQFKFVGKNIYTVVALVDLANPEHMDVLAILFAWISREIPMRFGIVPISEGNAGDSAHTAHFTKFLVDHYGLKSFRDYVIKIREGISMETNEIPAGWIEAATSQYFDEVKVTQLKKGVDTAPTTLPTALDYGKPYGEIANRYMQRMGVTRQEGAWFINGRIGEIGEAWQEELVEIYFKMLEYLQRKIYYGEIGADTNILDHFSTLPGVLPRRNPYISSPTPSKPAKFLDLSALILDTIPYLTNVKDDEGFPAITSWIAADFSKPASWELLISGLNFLVGDARGDARLGLFALPRANTKAPTPVLSLFQLASDKAAPGSDIVPALKTCLETLVERGKEPDEGFFRAHADKCAFVDKEDIPRLFAVTLDSNGEATKTSFAIGGDEALISVNGRVFGPFPFETMHLTKDDFDLAALTGRQSGANSIGKQLEGLVIDGGSRGKADAVLRLTSILGKEESAKELEGGFQSVAKTRSGVIPITVPGPLAEFTTGDLEHAIFHVYAVLDPVSTATQRLSAILENLLLLEELVAITVRLNPSQNLKDVPIKRFYRYVIQKDHDRRTAVATFKKLPEDTLLSLDMDVPNAWLAMPVSSVHDLDNIKLADLAPAERTKGIDSLFELTKVLVEGHCIDSKSKQPPRGLQMVLGSSSYPDMVDTIVMANLGYFQLKAGPGVWQMRLRSGRSSRLYDLDVVTEDALEFSKSSGGTPFPVASVSVRSFEGLTLFVKVSKKPGKEGINLLEEDGTATHDDELDKDGEGMWASIKKGLGFGGNGDQEPAAKAEVKSNETTINVFSVASGHLYERLMSVMFIGVMRHTKSPVKFWLIENFMSPTFKDFLPHMAKEYGFQYELVTYKWPHWLRGQTEKQRTIWGYKILFLDVLFPLSLDRVIFVDADQIVRTDLKELMEMDIGGAPYAYTPFCDSRQETEGYRFWRSGYWRNHLNGRAYHISALYLVDLARFRQMAAGDRLRGQYQMLSADPESLANLDQDLPNNLIHQVPIFSLPQDWLWCETWCDDESLKTAKTIDLCNNPMTKEPKLDRAKRQIPEWSVYDNEVEALATRLAQAKENASKRTAGTGSSDGASNKRDEL